MISRTLLISLLVYLLVFASCRKNNTVPLTSQLIGQWELRTLFGSQVPGIGPNFTYGNGNIWEFTTSGFKRYTNGQMTSSGIYTLTKTNTFNSGIPEDAVILNQDTTLKFHFDIIKDTLTIYVGSIPADGYIPKYVKQ
jgi:hypothetical protein